MKRVAKRSYASASASSTADDVERSASNKRRPVVDELDAAQRAGFAITSFPVHIAAGLDGPRAVAHAPSVSRLSPPRSITTGALITLSAHELARLAARDESEGNGRLATMWSKHPVNAELRDLGFKHALIAQYGTGLDENQRQTRDIIECMRTIDSAKETRSLTCANIKTMTEQSRTQPQRFSFLAEIISINETIVRSQDEILARALLRLRILTAQLDLLNPLRTVSQDYEQQ